MSRGWLALLKKVNVLQECFPKTYHGVAVGNFDVNEVPRGDEVYNSSLRSSLAKRLELMVEN